MSKTVSPLVVSTSTSAVLDRNWVRKSFMLSVNPRNIEGSITRKQENDWLYFTEAKYNFRNTSLGGNFTINSLPQYTIFADIPAGGIKRVPDRRGNHHKYNDYIGGMGRYYFESIDNWSQKVSFRFGVPEYKGLITFFTSFYDGGAAILARTGRLGKGIFYSLGKLMGNIIALPVTIMISVAEAMRWVTNRPSTRYYSLKTTMPLYWQRVNLILGMLTANLKLTSSNEKMGLKEGDAKTQEIFTSMDPNDFSKEFGTYTYEQIRHIYPELFNSAGGVDIYRVAGKAHRMQMLFNKQVREMSTNGQLNPLRPGETKSRVDTFIQNFNYQQAANTGKGIDAALIRYHESRLGARTFTDNAGNEVDLIGDDPIMQHIERVKGASLLQSGEQGGINAVTSGQITNTEAGEVNQQAAAEANQSTEGQSNESSESAGEATTSDNNIDPGDLLAKSASKDNYLYPVLINKDDGTDTENSVWDRIKGWGEPFVTYSKEQARDGTDWINFRVDPIGSISESFQNNTGESEIKNKINSTSASMQELRFTLADLKTGFGMIDMAIDGIRDTLVGIADGLHISGLASLMGSGYVDIPEKWTDSSAQFPTASYTIKCRPVYGNILSRYLNMYVPLACMLAAVLPISYGRHAYGSPFICEFYSQGKSQSRLAIIESLSITRGEGNLGWTAEGDFLGLDISFTVKDLSSTMHAPIDSAMDMLVNFRWLIADDSPFHDYMAALTNLSTAEMTYSWEKLKLNWSKYKVVNSTFFSPARMAMYAGNTMPGRLVRKLSWGQNISIQ